MNDALCLVIMGTPMNCFGIVVRFNGMFRKFFLKNRIILQLRQHRRIFGQCIFKGAAKFRGGSLFPGIDLEKINMAHRIHQVIATEHASKTLSGKPLAGPSGILLKLGHYHFLMVRRKHGADEPGAVLDELIGNAGDVDILFIGNNAKHRGIIFMGDIPADQIIFLFIPESF